MCDHRAVNDGEGSSCFADESIEAELARAADGPITIDLTTTGRSSGTLRRIEIWLLNIDGRLVITGTPGERDWLANIRRDPRVVVHLKEGATADLSGTAVEVLDPSERHDILTHPTTQWYRSRASVAELVGAAPTITITLGQ